MVDQVLPVYYIITVYGREKNAKSKSFRKTSNYPFLSPLGMELFIPVEDTREDQSFHAEVVDFVHENHYDQASSLEILGFMYMVLGVVERESRFRSRETGAHVCIDKPEVVWTSLVKHGWEEY